MNDFDMRNATREVLERLAQGYFDVTDLARCEAVARGTTDPGAQLLLGLAQTLYKNRARSPEPLWPLHEHPALATLAHFIQIQKYDRDGSARDPRSRIELREPTEAVAKIALAMQCACARCGAPIHPFRQRDHRGGIFGAVTCTLETSIGCSRSAAASQAYLQLEDVVNAIKGSTTAPPAAQRRLF